MRPEFLPGRGPAFGAGPPPTPENSNRRWSKLRDRLNHGRGSKRHWMKLQWQVTVDPVQGVAYLDPSPRGSWLPRFPPHARERLSKCRYCGAVPGMMPATSREPTASPSPTVLGSASSRLKQSEARPGDTAPKSLAASSPPHVPPEHLQSRLP
jgi:hypothetical protein